MDDGRRSFLHYRRLHAGTRSGRWSPHRHLPAWAAWRIVYAPASGADRPHVRVFKWFIDRPRQRSVVSAADLLCPTDCEALTMLARSMNLFPIASAVLIAAVATAGCESRPTGITQLPVAPSREQTAFMAPPPS